MTVSVDADESQHNDSEPDSAFAAASGSSDEDEEVDPVPLSDVNDEKCYKAMSRAVFPKSTVLWNKVKWSQKASDTAEEKHGIGFVVPNETRWNSVFLIMQQLFRILPRYVDEATCLHDDLILHTVRDEFVFCQFSPD